MEILLGLIGIAILASAVCLSLASMLGLLKTKPKHRRSDVNNNSDSNNNDSDYIDGYYEGDMS